MSFMYGPGDFAEFGNIEPDDDRPTWPSPGTAKIKFEDKCETLFISVTWKMVATVNGRVIEESWDSDKPHDPMFFKNWSLQVLRVNYEKLRSMGVDVEGEYVRLGGNVDDL